MRDQPVSRSLLKMGVSSFFRYRTTGTEYACVPATLARTHTPHALFHRKQTSPFWLNASRPPRYLHSQTYREYPLMVFEGKPLRRCPMSPGCQSQPKRRRMATRGSECPISQSCYQQLIMRKSNIQRWCPRPRKARADRRPKAKRWE